MKMYVLKKIEKAGICDRYYIYEEPTTGNNLKLVSALTINKDKKVSDEELLDTAINTFPNGEEISIKIIR